MDTMVETKIRSPRLPRNSGLGANFSYPKLSRHESSESRSSVASNGSLPGMTDASDSDVSFDDDCNYNTSANELWDRFWPDSTLDQEHQYPAVLRASRGRDNFNVNSNGRQPQEQEDETIKVPQLNYGYATGKPTATRPETKRSPVTYSVYPQPFRTDIRRVELPPRTSSLNPELSSQGQRRPFLKTAKSSAALKASKSAHSLHQLYLSPPSAAPTAPLPSLPTKKPTSSSLSATAYLTIPTTSANPIAASTPVSPAYPPPPIPNALRSSNSAFTLRENQHKPRSPQLPTSHNMTAPLTPLLKAPPSLPRSQYQQQQKQQQQQQGVSAVPMQPRPEPQRFVSVFEFDSDDEEDADSGSGWGRRGSGSSSSDGNGTGDAGSRLAKRIARGLGHKKSASEKRGRTANGGYGIMPPTPVLGSGGFEDNTEKSKERGGSLSRKRGGSLGRIFGGLMSR